MTTSTVGLVKVLNLDQIALIDPGRREGGGGWTL